MTSQSNVVIDHVGYVTARRREMSHDVARGWMMIRIMPPEKPSIFYPLLAFFFDYDFVYMILYHQLNVLRDSLVELGVSF